jgi:hypothetical protein
MKLRTLYSCNISSPSGEYEAHADKLIDAVFTIPTSEIYAPLSLSHRRQKRARSWYSSPEAARRNGLFRRSRTSALASSHPDAHTSHSLALSVCNFADKRAKFEWRRTKERPRKCAKCVQSLAKHPLRTRCADKGVCLRRFCRWMAVDMQIARVNWPRVCRRGFKSWLGNRFSIRFSQLAVLSSLWIANFCSAAFCQEV